jgi:hypothetical protein
VHYIRRRLILPFCTNGILVSTIPHSFRRMEISIEGWTPSNSLGYSRITVDVQRASGLFTFTVYIINSYNQLQLSSSPGCGVFTRPKVKP